jgi:hypothetical protein
MNPHADSNLNEPSLSLLALSALVLAVTAAKIQAGAEAQAAGGDKSCVSLLSGSADMSRFPRSSSTSD